MIAPFQQARIRQRAARISAWSRAVPASARYGERAFAKRKDLGRVRMGGGRNQLGGGVKATSKKEMSNERNE